MWGCAVCGLQNSKEKFRKLTLEALAKVQTSSTVSLLTVQLQDDQLYLSYKGAKRICLREEVYHDLLNNTHNLEILEQRVKVLKLELTKLQESSTNEPVKFSQFFGDQVARVTNIFYRPIKQKVMILCSALRNKQVGGTKTAIGLLMEPRKNVVNTLANMGKSSTYQTVYI
ncbi:uncharacterized protein OCT59_028012 [Rhizophagus irregularis]|uniref:uncharacterized protein n=1 Tax=Rhizophagus irregularis TaxID=588596 RepID=UPI00332A12DE|nr:hypothetical protein OCT59_028012 [Rhizophagus irregularis]